MLPPNSSHAITPCTASQGSPLTRAADGRLTNKSHLSLSTTTTPQPQLDRITAPRVLMRVFPNLQQRLFVKLLPSFVSAQTLYAQHSLTFGHSMTTEEISHGLLSQLSSGRPLDALLRCQRGPWHSIRSLEKAATMKKSGLSCRTGRPRLGARPSAPLPPPSLTLP